MKIYLYWLIFIGYIYFCHKFVTLETITYTHPIIILLLKLIYVPVAFIMVLAVLFIVAIKLITGGLV